MATMSKSVVPLCGLSIEETLEFKILEDLPALDEDGKPAWIFEGAPITEPEKRWLSLYLKHVQARPLKK